MKKLTSEQLSRMDAWMKSRARPLDLAKWNHTLHGGSEEAIIAEILTYRNPDGGLGNGFEPDVLLPLSAAIPTAEAIFTAYEYDLDCEGEWFKTILAYFENSVQDIPKYWEDCPREAMDYPHAPWWRYELCEVFNPNPCAIVASAFIRYGTESQRELGYKIARDCLDLLASRGFCGDHDTLCIMRLVEKLAEVGSPLITDEILAAMRRRIDENLCLDTSKWTSYTFRPLDFVYTPDSPWRAHIGDAAIEMNLDYIIDHLNADGVVEPSFSWGVDSEVSRRVTEQWRGYLTARQARILREFGRIE